MKGHDIDAIKEVFAELAFLDHFGKVAVGGASQADVDGEAGVAAKALDAAFLQNAEKLGLQGEAQVANLVEKKSAAFGSLEAAATCDQRAGKGTALVAEELVFDQGFRDAGTEKGDKGTFSTSAFAVDGPGEQLLAGACLTGNQDGDITGGDFLGQLEDLLHTEGGAQHAVHASLGMLAGTQLEKLGFDLAGLVSATEDEAELDHVRGVGDGVVGTVFHDFEDQGRLSVAEENDDRRGRTRRRGDEIGEEKAEIAINIGVGIAKINQKDVEGRILRRGGGRIELLAGAHLEAGTQGASQNLTEAGV